MIGMRGGSLNLTAVEEADDSVSELGLLLIVGHHHYRASVVLVERMEQIHDLGTHL